MMTLRTLLVISALLFLPVSAFAQVDAVVAVTPEYPAPYSQTVLTLSSYSFDVNTANITWSVNSKTALSGVGAKSLTLTMGPAGQSATVAVSAKIPGGETFSQTISVTPQSVDLVYEGTESYVPPFYEGKPLPGEGSAVRVVAFPTMSENGAVLSPSSLSYAWYMNDEFIDRVSGIGKSSATFLLDYLSDTTKIRVRVRSPLGNIAEKTVYISPHKTLPTFYEYDDVLGTRLIKAFTRRLELSKDITLSLVPYYLSAKNGMGQYATYTWYLDGLPVTPMEKTLLALKPKADTYGTRTLSVFVDNTKRKLEYAKEELEIIFDTRQ